MRPPKLAVRDIVVGASLIVATAAFAGDERQSNAGTETAMDTDQDGKLDAAEHATAARKMFETMDADKDGKVTAAEMAAVHAQMMGKTPRQAARSAEARMKRIDGNGDGAVSADEHAAAARKLFETLDADKDGKLSMSEIVAGHEKLHGHPK